ncbi:hypothetical protein GCM10025867_18220 [Frondihabitans sucicola]|uniref:MoaB/Mog domain-containing protein n=1 Tax=Frondihabitans sucicola TaxID=1268041 RepID=A0ABM8GMG3_9MICO|nr:hypothetical protein GCM10025867_18220 [Frondihabitans sucicola]
MSLVSSDSAAHPTRTALVVVASTRAARGEAPDRTGPVIAEWLAERGFTVDQPVVVADGEPVGQALIAGIAQPVSVIVTTGARASRRPTRPPR